MNKLAADRAILPALEALVHDARKEIESVIKAANDSKQTLKVMLAMMKHRRALVLCEVSSDFLTI